MRFSSSISPLPIKVSLLNESEACELGNKLEAVVTQIHQDYFPEVDYDDFWESCVFHESTVMKIAAYRFANSTLINNLKQKIIGVVSSLDTENNLVPNYLFHPIFYTRLTRPAGFSSQPGKSPLLDSQPHFDRSFDVYAYSFWLALRRADQESGGLCFFDSSSEVQNEFSISWGEKNKYNYSTYVDSSERLDPIIRDHIVHPCLIAGEAYLFDSNCLHAATKSKSKIRASFDFRVMPDYLFYDLDERSKKIFQVVNNDLNFSNAMNLIILGDIKGALVTYPEIESRLGMSSDDLIKTYSRYSPNILRQKFSWRDEYAYVDLI
jgi:hypothetical protein